MRLSRALGGVSIAHAAGVLHGENLVSIHVRFEVRGLCHTYIDGLDIALLENLDNGLLFTLGSKLIFKRRFARAVHLALCAVSVRIKIDQQERNPRTRFWAATDRDEVLGP